MTSLLKSCIYFFVFHKKYSQLISIGLWTRNHLMTVEAYALHPCLFSIWTSRFFSCQLQNSPLNKPHLKKNSYYRAAQWLLTIKRTVCLISGNWEDNKQPDKVSHKRVRYLDALSVSIRPQLNLCSDRHDGTCTDLE